MFDTDDKLNEEFDRILSPTFQGVRGRSSVWLEDFRAPGTKVRRVHRFIPHRIDDPDTPRTVVSDFLRPLPCEATVWSTCNDD